MALTVVDAQESLNHFSASSPGNPGLRGRPSVQLQSEHNNLSRKTGHATAAAFFQYSAELAASAIVAGAAVATSGDAVAHENHAPLPTKGVTIAGDTIMLSDKARAAIGLTTAKIAFGDIHRTVTVNARVELPWHRRQ